MPHFERGVYEPNDELRVFDGSEDDDDVEGSRLPLLIVLALLVLAMFAGVVWLAYTQGVARGRTETPVLTAQNGPARIAPQNPGGAEQPYKGFKIYEQPAPPDDDTATSRGCPRSPLAQSAPAAAAPKPGPAGCALRQTRGCCRACAAPPVRRKRRPGAEPAAPPPKAVPKPAPVAAAPKVNKVAAAAPAKPAPVMPPNCRPAGRSRPHRLPARGCPLRRLDRQPPRRVRWHRSSLRQQLRCLWQAVPAPPAPAGARAADRRLQEPSRR